MAAARRRRYGRGDTVIWQGDEAGSLFHVAQGRLKVRFTTPGGDSVLLDVLGPGEVFGELAVLVQRHERTASAEAMDDVVLDVMRRDDFDRLRAEHRDVDEFLLHGLARRVDKLTRRVAEAHYVPVERRLARRLFEAARAFHTPGQQLVLPFTQDDVAQLAGTTRPTANQVLKQLERDGVVGLARGRIEVLDVAALRSRCAWTSSA